MVGPARRAQPIDRHALPVVASQPEDPARRAPPASAERRPLGRRRPCCLSPAGWGNSRATEPASPLDRRTLGRGGTASPRHPAPLGSNQPPSLHDSGNHLAWVPHRRGQSGISATRSTRRARRFAPSACRDGQVLKDRQNPPTTSGTYRPQTMGTIANPSPAGNLGVNYFPLRCAHSSRNKIAAACGPSFRYGRCAVPAVAVPALFAPSRPAGGPSTAKLGPTADLPAIGHATTRPGRHA